MDINNPYTPPRAEVADINASQSFQEPSFWSSKGRIGRLRYLSYLTVGYLVFGLAVFVMGLIGGLGGLMGGGLGEGGVMAIVVGLLVIVGALAYLFFCILALIQRTHDMGWSGWAALLTLIPLVALVWVFMPGTQGDNRFGPPPTPNGVGVIIGALLLPVLFVLMGIMAAVALPAYQDYVQRAQSMQSP
jgi:uncharacterized membrane protein YhaH (DUF805 family)